MKFAKLFDVDGQQVLANLDYDEEGNMELVVTTMTNEGVMSTAKFGYENEGDCLDAFNTKVDQAFAELAIKRFAF